MLKTILTKKNILLKSLKITKEQRLVRKWKKEHQKISEYSHKALASYNRGDIKELQRYILILRDLTIKHLMEEDIEFYRQKRENSNNEILMNGIDNFIETFKEIKKTWRDFICKYAKEEALYDKDFHDKFEELIHILEDRIRFEEETLYRYLSNM